MTVSKPIIVVPSKTRQEVRMVVGQITGVAPPAVRITVQNGIPVSLSQDPEREGQMLFYQGPDSGQTVVMYVVVNYDGLGALQWAPVVPNTVPIDPRSGKPKDPLYDFYGLHAS